MSKITISWLLAVIITLTAVYYQRKTGPTYPYRTSVHFNNTDYKIKLLRSCNSTQNAEIKLDINDSTISGEIYYRRFPTNDNWIQQSFKFQNSSLIAELPSQAPAGKLEYYIVLKNNYNKIDIAKEHPVRIRFKGEVPYWALLPHIIIIFIAMLLSNVTGIFAIYKLPRLKLYTILTFCALLIGGMTFGPIVQYYAFGDAWTGIPFGWDLTDNKTLIAFIFWTIALIVNLKKQRPWWIIAAAIILLAIYSIPHSMFGSELDYNSGTIISA